MSKIKLLLYLLGASLLLGGCSLPLKDSLENIEIAIGYAQHREDAINLQNEFLKFLPKQYNYSFNLMTIHDINFEKKDVSWHLGIGRTDYALKEMASQIKFLPFAWDNKCVTNSELIFLKRKKKNAKVLFLNAGYISPSSIYMLFEKNIQYIELLTTSNQKLALELLFKKKVDFIINETIIQYLSNSKNKLTKIPNRLKNTTIEASQIAIPCRTYFYSPKLNENERAKFFELFITNLKIGSKNRSSILPLDEAQFYHYLTLFDWQKDELIRKRIKQID